MHLNNDYCYMLYKEHHEELLRRSEQSRLVRMAESGAPQQSNFVRQIVASVAKLIRDLNQRESSVREVTQ